MMEEISVLRFPLVEPFRLLLLGSTVLWLTSCNQADPRVGHPEEDEDGRAAVVTLWGDRFEIFMEYDYVVVNEPVRFITHVTDLVTLEPRRDGLARFIFTDSSGEILEHTDPAVARAGIYIPELRFVKTGEWRMLLEIPLEGQTYSIEMPPVTVYASREEVAGTPEPVEAEGISFLKEQQWNILTRTEPVERMTLSERLALPGFVTAPPGNTAVVTPPIAGRLLPPANGALPYVGDTVKAGTALIRIQPPLAGSDVLTAIGNRNQIRTMETDLHVKASEARAAADNASLELQHAQHVLERTQELYEKSAKSKRELEEDQFAVREARARLKTQRGLLQTYDETLERFGGETADIGGEDGLPSIELRAPIAGTVVEVNATIGEHVQPDRVLLKLVDTSNVFIVAQAPEADIQRLSKTQHALYTLPGNKEDYLSISEQGGRLVFIGATVDSKTRTVPLVYETPNPEGALRLGMSVTVFAETSHADDTLAIPESALVDEDGVFVAYVQVSGETFAKRELALGFRDGKYVQVLSGLDEGEHVVTKGAYAIRLASVSTVIPAHGHAH
jgi:RND family efflux transporter MFP subunit